VNIDLALRIGISACLVGQEVRYDGGHKLDPLVMEIFGPRVEWIPVCPEVEVGMGTPREPVRLERGVSGVRMLAVHTRVDYTSAMSRWAEERIAALSRAGLDGYVLKSDSPSCGREGVRVFDAGVPSRTGTGLFAAALIASFPALPVEDEVRLHDSGVREQFLDRVLEYHRSKNPRR
jgi:uncharacterized protein YbbK (DUF523 family)